MNISQLLENGRNLLGAPLRPEHRQAIVDYVRGPGADLGTWKTVRNIVVMHPNAGSSPERGQSLRFSAGRGYTKTIWQAVVHIDADFHDEDLAPDPFTVARAIREHLGD